MFSIFFSSIAHLFLIFLARAFPSSGCAVALLIILACALETFISSHVIAEIFAIIIIAIALSSGFVRRNLLRLQPLAVTLFPLIMHESLSWLCFPFCLICLVSFIRKDLAGLILSVSAGLSFSFTLSSFYYLDMPVTLILWALFVLLSLVLNPAREKKTEKRN